MKAASKTQLLKQQQQRASPYARRATHSATVPKGSHRALDTNDYSQKHDHDWMYVRDATRPQVHYRIRYTPELELWLLSHSSLDAAHPPRYSSIRTTTHPTHKMLGSDVKSFHQLKDSGFRYQEKFPHCVRICLSGMGKTGSSNRPYALCMDDFTHHFATIALAYRGVKKAKLCLYEQPAHRPRVEWLRQLTHLVFTPHLYDAAFTVRQMHFDGQSLAEIETDPAPVAESLALATTFFAPSPTAVSCLSPPPASRLQVSPSMPCEEELTASDEDDVSDMDTVVQELAPSPTHQLQPIEHAQVSADSQSTVEEEEELWPVLDSSPRLLSSPVPVRTHSLNMPLPSPSASFSLGGPSHCSPAPLRLPSTVLLPDHSHHFHADLSASFASHEEVLENTDSRHAPPHRLASVGGFAWPCKTDSITADTATFFSQQGHAPSTFAANDSLAEDASSSAFSYGPSTLYRASSISCFFNDESSRHAPEVA